MLTAETFGERVNEYVELEAQIKEGSKMVSVLKKKKCEIGESLLEFMKEKGIVACNISQTGGKLIRRPQRSLETVKREYVEEILAKELQDPNMAEKLADLVYQNRNVREKEILKLTVKRNTGEEIVIGDT
jgi:hypothetical protein